MICHNCFEHSIQRLYSRTSLHSFPKFFFYKLLFPLYLSLIQLTLLSLPLFTFLSLISHMLHKLYSSFVSTLLTSLFRFIDYTNSTYQSLTSFPPLTQPLSSHYARTQLNLHQHTHRIPLHSICPYYLITLSSNFTHYTINNFPLTSASHYSIFRCLTPYSRTTLSHTVFLYFSSSHYF